MPRKKNRFLGPAFLLAVGVAAGWWLTRQGLPLLESLWDQAAPAAAGDIRRVDFRNFSYPAQCAADTGLSGGVPVRNGEFRREESHNPLFFSVLSVSYGDLTGDGQPEAAIATNCNTGGTGQFSEGMVFSMRRGKPLLFARVDGGDRAYGGIAAITISNGRLIVERYATDEGDPSCCPRYIETTRLRWDGTRLVQDGAVTRRPMASE